MQVEIWFYVLRVQVLAPQAGMGLTFVLLSLSQGDAMWLRVFGVDC